MDRQVDIHGQAGRQIDMQVDRLIGRQMDRQIDGQVDRWIGRQMDMFVDR